jgi:HAMP domain-containing protein
MLRTGRVPRLTLLMTSLMTLYRLRALAAEVTRVTLEVGSQGKLGGQAHVPDVEGVWLNLVRNVNRMCSSLTDQVRSIAVVTTAVARGDLTQKIEISVEGEMSTLKGTLEYFKNIQMLRIISRNCQFNGGSVICVRIRSNASGFGSRNARYIGWSG